MKSLIFNFLTEKILQSEPSFIVEGSKNADPLKIINFVVILFLIIIICLTAYTIFLHHKINKLEKKNK